MKSELMTLAVGFFLTLGSGLDASAFYNPQTGRWLSRDPIGEQGGRDLYGFVSNRPAERYDVLGRAKDPDKYEFTWNDGDSSATLTVKPSAMAFMPCFGGWLLFNVHFYVDVPDDGNNYFETEGVTFAFAGANSLPQNFVKTPSMEWDIGHYQPTAAICPEGPQSGSLSLVAGTRAEPSILTVEFRWSYSCQCCDDRASFRPFYFLVPTPPLYQPSTAPGVEP